MEEQNKRSIATRTGDKGDTSLMFGVRVDKDHQRVEAYGTIDEMSSMLGLARSHCEQEYLNDIIIRIQHECFIVCGELATTPENLPKLKKVVTKQMVEALDHDLKEIETKHTYTMDWSTPGDHPASAALDVARAVCRRAERYTVNLYRKEAESANEHLLKYLNRLSDLLWLMARWQEKEHNVKLTSVRDFLDDGKS